MDEIANLFTLALAHSATNLDNLALLIVLTQTMGPARASLAYVASQVLVFSAAQMFSLGFSTTFGTSANYLGLVPIVIGCYTLLFGTKPAKETSSSNRASYLMATATFTVLSFDTLAIFAPILADGAPIRDYSALAGGSISVVFISFAPILFRHSGAACLRLTKNLEKVVPFVIIAVGMYVLLDTPDDLN